MAEDKHIRTFVALNLPVEVQTVLDAFLRSAQAGVGSPEIRWAEARQIHLTLRFLGSVPLEAVENITAALRRACQKTAPFVLRASGLGCFPDPRRPRIFWAGVTGDLDALNHLHSAIQRDLRAWGKTEDREFHPHLTLARVKESRERPSREWGGLLAQSGSKDFGAWRVETIDLMRSEMFPEGARYSCLAAVRLA